MIDDPFDPPGYGRFGGGNLFLFDLGRYLIRRGFIVTYIIRKNSSEKKSFERLGNNCTIIRLQVGPEKEISPKYVASLIEPLKIKFSEKMEELEGKIIACHSIYWISGIVVLEYCKANNIRLVHSILSLGRLKISNEQCHDKIEKKRDSSEVLIFNEADDLIVVCPNEKNNLYELYPEVKNTDCHIVPYGIDEKMFFPRPESPGNFVCRSANRFKQGD